jgi:asparagine synthase (glutamine-hydrolysing)
VSGLLGYFSRHEALPIRRLLAIAGTRTPQGSADHGYVYRRPRSGEPASGDTCVHAHAPRAEAIHGDFPVSAFLAHLHLGGAETPENAQQPVRDTARELWLSFDGQIYNRAELDADLAAEGVAAEASSTPRAVLLAYRCWGEQFVERLNGKWALAIWDADRETLLLSRDRLGLTPLYVHARAGSYLVSSRLRPLVALVPDLTINEEFLVSFLRSGDELFLNQAHVADTFFTNVANVKPGHNMHIDLARDVVWERRYWRPWQRKPAESMRLTDEVERQCVTELQESLCSSLAYCLRATSPIACTMSGGLDSSVIVALLNTRFDASPVNTRTTFTLRFEEDSPDSPLRAFRTRYPTPSVTVLVTADEFLDAIPEMVAVWEVPVGFGIFYTHHRLAAEISARGFRTALFGHGADELFLGFDSYVYKYLELSRPAPSAGVQPLPAGLCSYASWVRGAEPCRWFCGEQRKYGELSCSSFDDYLEQHFNLEYKLAFLDKSYRACSLEARCPFLDHRVVEMAFSLPVDFKIRLCDQHGGFETKHILKRAFEHLLPEEVIRQKKVGMLGLKGRKHWFSTERFFTLVFDLLDSEDFRLQGRYQHAAIRDDLRAIRAGDKEADEKKIWRLVNVILWERLLRQWRRETPPVTPTPTVG